MTEQWRSIKNYEGLYEVSNWGRVKNTRTGRVLKPMKNWKGYLNVILCKDGVHKTCKVHRLVAQAFLPNPNNHPQVNHINEDKTDNRVDNLEWCDGAYNVRYSQTKTVYQYTLDGQLVRVWPSTQECARNGFYQNAISNCCNGKRKTHKGFRWSYNPPA